MRLFLKVEKGQVTYLFGEKELLLLVKCKNKKHYVIYHFMQAW